MYSKLYFISYKCKYRESHVTVYNTARFSHVEYPHKLGILRQTIFRVHVILNAIDLRCSLYITMYITCLI